MEIGENEGHFNECSTPNAKDKRMTKENMFIIVAFITIGVIVIIIITTTLFTCIMADINQHVQSPKQG